MYQEETFVDDIQFSNAVGGSQLQDLRENIGNRSPLVGLDLLNREQTKRNLSGLNNLFNRLKSQTDTNQRDSIIKTIESLRETIKKDISDIDKIDDPKLLAQLTVDLSKPIKYVDFQEYMTIRNTPIKSGTAKEILYQKGIPVNIKQTTPAIPATPSVPDTPVLPQTPSVPETPTSNKNTKLILLGLGGLAIVYYFFIRKKS